MELGVIGYFRPSRNCSWIHTLDPKPPSSFLCDFRCSIAKWLPCKSCSLLIAILISTWSISWWIWIRWSYLAAWWCYLGCKIQLLAKVPIHMPAAGGSEEASFCSACGSGFSPALTMAMVFAWRWPLMPLKATVLDKDLVIVSVIEPMSKGFWVVISVYLLVM